MTNEELQYQLAELRAIVERQQTELNALRTRSPVEEAPAQMTVVPSAALSRRQIFAGAVVAIGGAHLLTAPSAGAQVQPPKLPNPGDSSGVCAASTEPEVYPEGYTGCRNTSYGVGAGKGLHPDSPNYSSGGHYNTAVGFEAMMAAVGGRATQEGVRVPFTEPYCYRNTAIGRGALRDTADSYENVAVGCDAGRHTIIGSKNTFVGSNAGKWVGSLDPVGDRLAGVTIGASSEWTPTGGQTPNDTFPNEASRNTLVGRNAGHKGVRIQACVAVGYNAGSAWYTNDGCIAIGRNSFYQNPSANNTVALGTSAMAGSRSGGSDSVAVGHEALLSATGNNNVAIGAYAGRLLTDGGQNVIIGEQAAGAKTSGSDNVFVGRLAGEQNIAGSGNIFVGRMAGRTETASNTLIIHNATTTPFLKGSMGEGDNWWLRLRGNFEPSAACAFDLGSASMRWRSIYLQNGPVCTSDATLKIDIAGDDLGIDFVRELRPVVWKWRDKEDDGDHRGLLAQEVRAALEKLKNRRGFAGLVEGETMGLCMTEFIGPLIKSVQQLDDRLTKLEKVLLGHDAPKS